MFYFLKQIINMCVGHDELQHPLYRETVEKHV